jgi:anthranilate/para-aminobenzoate synthase component I
MSSGMLEDVLALDRRARLRVLPRAVSPDALLAALVHRRRPVLAPFASMTLVAADPVEVVEGPAVWDVLDVPSSGPSAGAAAAAGGWVGLLAYDLAGTVERLPPPLPDPGGPPVAALGRYETVAMVDAAGRCTLASVGDAAALEELEALALQAGGPPPAAEPAPAEVESSLDAASYREMVAAARELIAAGDCYQVNLVQRLRAPWPHGPRALASRLWAAAGPASHRAYVDTGRGVVISASPERLLSARHGVAASEPIKGTAGPGEAARLATSAKDLAEHVMIVDLVRNDLGRVAVAGGVSVPRLFAGLETPYASHMVSQVRARLIDGVAAADALRAVFPAGSVTGAPKVRAMEVIRELEPVGRGPAFGSVVAVGRDGQVEASVAIRTAWLAGGEARYWCGGGIVWDSDPDGERRESWAKAAPFLSAIGRG